MLVERLKLNQFRNYEALLFEPSPALNVIVGENAQGKTNALEAIFLCAFGRSHRTARDAELIAHGMSGAYVGLGINTRLGSRSIEVKLRSGERKELYIDRIGAQRSGELMGILNAVMFSPEYLELVKGAPAERRRFMDMEISQTRPTYYYTLQRYNAALRQRNALLRFDPENRRTTEQLRRELYVWDEQLSSLGAEVMRARLDFIAALTASAGALHAKISNGREKLSVRYLPNVDAEAFHGDGGAAMAEALYSGALEDIRRGYTSSGPHRDDLSIEIDSRPVRVFGSQGQQRTAALALKLSEIELIREVRGEAPVLLLDDVFSELDPLRQRALLESASKCQCFLTCTGLEGIRRAGLEGMAVWRCAGGALTRES